MRPRLWYHLVLDRDGYLNEYVVLSFCLNLNVELLDLHAQAVDHGFDEGRLPIQPGASNARELSEPLYDGYLRRLNGEERTEDYAQNKEKYDACHNEQQDRGGLHVCPPYRASWRTRSLLQATPCAAKCRRGGRAQPDASRLDSLPDGG